MIILSGIQPSGTLHVGNYFGMMHPAIDLQEQGEAYYFIANYHSMTSVFDADERRKTPLTLRWIFSRAGSIRPSQCFFAKVMCRRCAS